MVGITEKSKFSALEIILWRLLRGNIFLTSKDIVFDINITSSISSVYEELISKYTDNKKIIFLIYCPSDGGIERIIKICNAAGCTLFFEESFPQNLEVELTIVEKEIDEHLSLIFNVTDTFRSEVSRFLPELRQYYTFIKLEISIFATMNCFDYDPNRKGLIAEGWCETSRLEVLIESFRFDQTSQEMTPFVSIVDSNELPPTLFRSPNFIKSFQEMTNAYSIVTYKELNPAIFMVSSFSFMFALMFGDIGHALILLFVSIFLILKPEKLNQSGSEVVSILVGGRYVILLLSLFSIFTGLIFNDFFSLTLTFFKSKYQIKHDVLILGYTYPFGLDPIWNLAENGLVFTNSYKMKQAIIIGIAHMSLGYVVAIFNSIRSNDYQKIIGKDLPKLLFLIFLFGYLCMLIIIKWVIKKDVSLLNIFISMILEFGGSENNPKLYNNEVI